MDHGCKRLLAFQKARAEPDLALLKGVWAALATGYEAQTGEPALDQLLSPAGWRACWTQSG